MRKIKEVLRLHWVCGLGQRQIGRSVNISKGAVAGCLRRAAAAGLTWAAVESMDETALEIALYRPSATASAEIRPVPDWANIYHELQGKGVTLMLLWQEYKDATPNGLQYSQFCDLFRRWRKKLDLSMRQPHRAGEKLFVDYSGQTAPIVDPNTGEVREAEIFIAVLGASNYTYAEATWSQDLADWIGAHTRALAFFGGVPELLIPDNLLSGVTKPCRYEPELNRTYQDLADYYGTAVIPARVGKAKDKAKVEVGVQVSQRWILASLRKQRFFSLAQLNAQIKLLLERLNNRPFAKLPGSRRSTFEAIDKPALKPLPEKPFEMCQWLKVRVAPDYHVAVEKSYYSVPYQLARLQVEARITANTVEILHKGRRVASHVRSYRANHFSTIPDHMPPAHRAQLDWTPSRIINWAAKQGPAVKEFVEKILTSRRHPEQGFRSSLGVMRLGKSYGTDRLNAACARGLALGTYSYRSVSSILQKGLDREPLDQQPADPPSPRHANVRGPAYYREGGPSC